MEGEQSIKDVTLNLEVLKCTNDSNMLNTLKEILPVFITQLHNVLNDILKYNIVHRSILAN